MLKPVIILDTETLIAVNKPPGLLTIPDRFDQHLPTLKKFLETNYGKVWVVHRLDRDTSGLIIFAKDESTHKFLSQLFKEKTINKYYLGLVNGQLSEKKSMVDVPIGEHPSIKGKMVASKKGKPSITHYEVLQQFNAYSWVQFRIETGRTHQIRVHMQYLGHPVVCDEIYGTGNPILLSSLKKNYKLSKGEEAETPLLNRLGLHSWKLQFTDASGINQDLEAPPPKDLKALLQQLSKWKY
jgi:23S rRNA pseudouridine1911/1915/1917 synthase